MLAARDQENLVYTHQTNAVGKPLNAGFRGLPSKTPGQRAPKTPFKASVNDENKRNVVGVSRAGLKTLDKGNVDRAELGGKGERNAFVTPMALRNRAPLGAKTTNAKARAIQTPAPLQQTVKPEKTLRKASTARKSVKSKIHVAVTEPVVADVLSKDEDSDVSDVEYCPPPTVDLPDPPEDIPYDDNFPYLRGKNLCGGYGEVYDIPRDEHGVSLQERREEEAYAKLVQGYEDRFRKQMAEPWQLGDIGEFSLGASGARPRKNVQGNKEVSTVRAKGAVTALSTQPSSRLPSAATKETASSMQKKRPTKSLLARKRHDPQPTDPSPMRHTAAVAASKQTIGYSKGRAVSSILPAKKSTQPEQSLLPPAKPQVLHERTASVSKLRNQFKEDSLFGDEDEEDVEGLGWGTGASGDEDDEEIVELPMPEETCGDY